MLIVLCYFDGGKNQSKNFLQNYDNYNNYNFVINILTKYLFAVIDF